MTFCWCSVVVFIFLVLLVTLGIIIFSNVYISSIFVIFLVFYNLFFLSYFEVSFFLKINFFFIDSLLGLNIIELIFSSRVLLISFFIKLFRLFYIKDDLSKNRFFLLTLFFIFSIIILILSKSLVVLILGWEGLGIFSYLLIIYYLKNNSLMSGMLTLLINRIGDIFFILGLRLWLIRNIDLIFFRIIYTRYIYSFFVVVFIMVAIFSKSPQYPLNSWLLAAISAPTPISSLVHSSTLVTAGCLFFFKLIIIYFFFKYKIFLLNLIFLTIFYSRLSGLVINDIKKIIALSTLRQISLVFLIFLVNLNVLGFLHLRFHAFFKSSLFIISGFLMIYSCSGQDNRYQKILYLNSLIEVLWIYVNFSLTAFFLVFRFFTKEKLIHYFFRLDVNFSFLFFLSCLLTILYSWKLMFNSLNIYKIKVFNLFTRFEVILFPLTLLIFRFLLWKGLTFFFFLNELLIFNLNNNLFVLLLYLLFLIYFFMNLIGSLRIFFFSLLKNIVFRLKVSEINFYFLNLFFNLKKNLDKSWSEMRAFTLLLLNKKKNIKIFRDYYLENFIFIIFIIIIFFLI